MSSQTIIRSSSSSGHGNMQVPSHAVFPGTPAGLSSVKELLEFICMGPLLNKIRYSPEKEIRIYHYYVPVFLWCEEEIRRHRSMLGDEEDIPPLVIGFSAPQGCGKTTLVFALDYLFKTVGRKSATVSIDDFYLTADEQAKVRESNPGNALLELRGNAGTHDLSLSVETLSAVCSLTTEGKKIKIPRYNKFAHNGRGDRADPSTWPEVEGPLTVVLLEGWMLGFKPLPAEIVKQVDPQLVAVNKNLERYHESWDKFINSWIVVKIQEPKCVYTWRLQAEMAMKDEGKPGMSHDEVMDFVSRYLPAYRAYLPTLYSEGPNGADSKHLLIVEIDEGRNPTFTVEASIDYSWRE